MNRVFLNIGFITIYWYSIFILLGIVFGLFVIIREIKRQHLSVDEFLNMAFYTIIVGILGARLYYVLFNFKYYFSFPLEIFKIWNGGLAIHGGIIAGGLFVLYYTRKHKMDTLKMLDMIVVGLIIGQAIGRWGNFFNGEAYGLDMTRNELLNMHLPKFIVNGMKINGIYYEPSFLYESLWDLFGFIVLVVVRRIKSIKIGQITGLYLIIYSTGRFFIEKNRADSLMLGNIKVAMLVSLILFGLGIYLLVKSYKNGKDYNNKIIAGSFK